ncbi:MAG: translation initiation factor IF-3 [Gammaproteobacteria bacterium]|nr:translation initiation factor IF-3 [Gammaproteobacteria bacterium]
MSFALPQTTFGPDQNGQLLPKRTQTIAKEKQQRTNDQITSDPVRLIDSEGNQVGVVSLAEAMQNAEEADLDLVEISPNADPPVCRVMDYGKFLYNASKQKHEAKKKQKQITVKEVKFRPGTDVGDYEVKLRNLTRFLEAGNKTKVTMRFRGREMAHKELGLEMLKKVEEDLSEIATVEQAATMEGRQMVMVMGPKRA